MQTLRIPTILWLTVFLCSPVLADSEDTEKHSPQKLSLIEVAPALYYTAARSLHFYGDDRTKQGDWAERSNLLGELGGFRNTLVDNGIFIDISATQFLQKVTDGGADDSNDWRNNGSADVNFWLDTGKAGLWPGGAVYAHFETNWSNSINGDAGSMLPANFDAVMPTADSPDSALSELYLMQALSAQWVLAAGKQNFAAWADTNTFANNEKDQFTTLSLINNPIAGVFFPYTTLGSWLTWTPTENHTLTAVWAKKEGKPGSSGLSDIDDSDNSYALQYIFTANPGGKPGHYLLAAAFTNQKITEFQLTQKHLYSDSYTDVIELTLADANDNYAVVGNFDQYLWVRDTTPGNRPESRPEGIGLFARAGWSPDDRNAIDQFYSFGIGGYGMLIPGRSDDNWGIGWGGSHISDDLRELSSTSLREWEHAYEIFYNFALLPYVQLSLNAQSIKTAPKSVEDDAITVAARLQITF